MWLGLIETRTWHSNILPTFFSFFSLIFVFLGNTSNILDNLTFVLDMIKSTFLGRRMTSEMYERKKDERQENNFQFWGSSSTRVSLLIHLPIHSHKWNLSVRFEWNLWISRKVETFEILEHNMIQAWRVFEMATMKYVNVEIELGAKQRRKVKLSWSRFDVSTRLFIISSSVVRL